jgi:hypothetical protein
MAISSRRATIAGSGTGISMAKYCHCERSDAISWR